MRCSILKSTKRNQMQKFYTDELLISPTTSIFSTEAQTLSLQMKGRNFRLNNDFITFALQQLIPVHHLRISLISKAILK